MLLNETTLGTTVVVERDGYQVVLVTDPGATDAAQWDAVALAGGGSIFHSHEWHTAFAAAPPGDMAPAHILAYHRGRPVGLCPAYLVHECPRLQYMMSLGRPRGLVLDGPVLLAHSLAALAGGPVAVDGSAQVLGLMDEGLRVAAAVLGAAAWGYANVPADTFTGRLIGSGYAVAEVATDYRLTVEWPTSERYWASLPGHRRRSLRGEQHRTARKGLRIEAVRLDEESASTLVQDLAAARGTPREVLPAPFLHAVMRGLAPFERSLAAYDTDGRVVAVFAGWQFGRQWSLWLAGLDSARWDTFTPYHAMLGAAIESAIEEPVAIVDLGRANGAVKRRYGARSRPLMLVLRSADRATDAALHLWCQNLQSHHHAALNGLETTSRCC